MKAAREVRIFAQLGERWLRLAYRLSATELRDIRETLKKCRPDRDFAVGSASFLEAAHGSHTVPSVRLKKHGCV
jgi:hypothetical protein